MSCLLPSRIKVDPLLELFQHRAQRVGQTVGISSVVKQSAQPVQDHGLVGLILQQLLQLAATAGEELGQRCVRDQRSWALLGQAQLHEERLDPL